MKVKSRRNVKVPLAVRDTIDTITNARSKEGHSLLKALKDFEWKDQYHSRYERGEFSHWLELFNYFDEWFEKYVTGADFKLLKPKEGTSSPSFDVEVCLEILRVSRTIFENCTSKHAYGSLEHLANLLAAPQAEVVFATLTTLVALSRRSLFQSTARWHHGNTELSSRLFSLAQGWGGNKSYSSMHSCIARKGDKQGGQENYDYDLHFEFFREEEYKGKSKGHQVIHLPYQDLQEGTNHQVFEKLREEHGVPQKLCFALLNRIRIIRSLENPSDRVDSVRMRLMAFHILCQSSPDIEELSLVLNEPGLVQDLLDVLYNSEKDCEDLQNLAARALASMCCDRSRQALFLRTLNSGQQKEKFVLFLNSAIKNASHGGNNKENKLLESVLSLISVLSVSNLGCAILSQLGLVQILLTLMKMYPGPQLQIVSGAVRILEALVERDAQVMRAFGEFEGLKIMISRLQRELGLLDNDSIMEDCEPSKRCTAESSSPGVSKLLAKRFLVKSLLRTIALTCYNNGEWTQSRLTFDGESAALPSCLEAIFQQAKDLGSSVFALAATVMGDLLHHDPTCFSKIQSHGLPKAFLSTVQNGVLVTPDTVCCLPSTLVALCLNKDGLKEVKNSKVLSCLVSILTSPQHCRALQGDTPSMLGNGLDELVRHVPDMKEACIDVLFEIVNKILDIGSKLKKKGLGQQSLDLLAKSSEDLGEAQPMETEANAEGEECNPSSSSTEIPSEGHFESMSELVSNTARLLEAMLSNPSVGEPFVKKGGVQQLLQLYAIPVKNPSPSTIHQLFATFRVLIPSHSKDIATSLIDELGNLLMEWEKQNNKTKICSYMLEDHLGKSNGTTSDTRERPILSTLHALEGLLSLSGNLLRSSSLMLNGISTYYSTKLLELLGSFQSSMIWYSCLFDEIKRHHDNKPKKVNQSTDGASTSASNSSQKKSEDDPNASKGSKASEHSFVNSFKKNANQEPFLDVINRVLLSIRQLFQALARNLLNERRINRNRDPHALHSPSKEAFNAAACLARLSLDYFTFSENSDDSLTLEKLVIDEDKSLADDYSNSLLRRAKISFVSQSIEEVSNLLSDPRRKTCNALLVNGFVRGSVLRKIIWCLDDHVQALNLAKISNNENLDERLLTKVITKMLAFLGTIIHQLQVTNLQSMLLVKFPEGLIESVFKGRNVTEIELPQSMNEFHAMLQQEVLEEVSRIWKFGLKRKLPQEVVAALLVIFHKAAQENKNNTSKVAGKIEKKFVPDERVIEQILAMGFTRKQAENAITRVRSNSLEIAMEWLLSHPEEVPEDDEIARAVAMSLEPKDSKDGDTSGSSKAASKENMKRFAVPSVDEFLGVFFNCLEASSLEKKEVIGKPEIPNVVLANSFALVEVLARLSSKAHERKGENTKSIVRYFMAKLSQCDNQLHMFASLHILLLLASKSSEIRHQALEDGVIGRCFDLLKSNASQFDRSASPSATTEQCIDPSNSKLPRWISPLFLLVDSYLKILSNHQNPLNNLSTSASSSQDAMSKAMEQLRDSNLQLEFAKYACSALKLVCTFDETSPDSEKTKNARKSSGYLRKECCQACLQIISTVCRKHSNAMKIYKTGILEMLLSIPQECSFPALEYLVFSILRYIVEDPVTLQSAMESQIHKVFQSSKFKLYKDVELKTICKSFVPFYSRDKDVFRSAISSTCQIQKKNGKVFIFLKQASPNVQKEENKRKSRNSSTKAMAFPTVVQALLKRITSNVSLLFDKGKKQGQDSCDDNRGKFWMDVQCIGLCLSVLTDFCIHYSSCLHYILKADLNMNVFNFVVDNLLPLLQEKLQNNFNSAISLKGRSNPSIISERSSYFLVAACARSSEARHRIIKHIVSKLKSLPSYSSAGYKPIEVTKLRAIVDFIHTLLSNSNNMNGLKLGASDDRGWSKDLIKDMREMKVVDALICAINNVELHNPGATKILNAILRPLNIVLEALNKSAVSITMEGKDKKADSGNPGRGIETVGSGQGREECRDDAEARREGAGQGTQINRILQNYPPISSLQSPVSIQGEMYMNDMHDTSEEEDVPEYSDSYSDSLSSSGSQSSTSVSGTVQDFDDDDDDEGDEADNQHEPYEVVVGGGRDEEDNGREDNMNGTDHIADNDRNYHSRTVLRVSEVNMDTDSQSDSELDEDERNNDMIDEDEGEYAFHATEDNSEEDWSDSPVIEVRVRSPFQMRFNNGGSLSARESVGLQTGIPLLDNFFGALGVSDDGLVGAIAPRSLQNLSRANRYPSGLHPLYNPSYNPLHQNGNGNSLSSDGAYNNQSQFSNHPGLNTMLVERLSDISDRYMHNVNRVHQRYSNSALESWNIWQADWQNDGFEILNSNESLLNSTSARYGRGDRNSSSKESNIEESIVELVMKYVPLKTADSQDSKGKEVKKIKEKGSEAVAKAKAKADEKTDLTRVEGENAQSGENIRNLSGARISNPVQNNTANENEGQPSESPRAQETQARGGTNSNIDPAFLEALPEDLRAEVLSQGPGRQSGGSWRQSQPAEPVSAQQPVQDLDPEFLAALPPDIQNEVLAQQQSAQNVQAQEAPSSGAEMDIASIIATFPPDIREEVLLTLDESIVNSLPPEILAEAQSVRERVNSRSFQTYTFGGQDNTYSAVAQRTGARAIQGRLLLTEAENNRAPSAKGSGLANKWAYRRDTLSHMQPSVSASGIASIVRLLRVAQPLGKGLMHRVLMNICGHSESCKNLLACFSEILGYAMLECRAGESASDSDETKVHNQYQLYGCQGDAYFAQKSFYRVPNLVLQRTMTLLTYLIRHDPEISSILMTSMHLKNKKGVKDRKGKSAARRKSDVGEKTTIVELLFELLSKEFHNNGSMFDLILQLIEGILLDITKLIPKQEESTTKEQEDKSKKSDSQKFLDCQEALKSLSGSYLASLPVFFTANVERTSSDHLQNVMSYTCRILPTDYTEKIIDALSLEGKKIVSLCESEIGQEASENDSSYLRIKSGFVLLKIASNIGHLSSKQKKFDLKRNEGFRSFQKAAQVLWSLLERHAVTLETMLKKIAPKEGAIPIAPQSILPYFPVVEAFAILSSFAKTDEGKVKNDPELDTNLSFVAFADKHSLLVNSFIRHDSSCLEENFKILLKHPRLIEFENKCSYFRSRINKGNDDHHHGSLRICVRRDCVFEDSFHQLRHRTAQEMHGRLNVQFQGEDGVDAGGLTREWYQVMSRAIFKEELALFTSGGNGITFQPNPNSMIQNEGVDHLQYFKFVGRFVAKALIDGQILDAYFTRSLYKHLLAQPLSYEDIEAVDPDYFKNLKWMLENDINGVLELNFTAETDYFDKKDTIELKPGGSKIAVTNDNKAEYVNLITKHRMTNAIEQQILAFLEGFWEIVPKDLLEMFNDNELELLISGLPDIDIFDLKANTEYVGYFSNSPVIRWFWEILTELNKEDKARLLQFCTGTSKVPLEGFKALQGVSGPQKFQIHKSYGASSLLPTAHTCFNQLDLVEYESKEKLKERLLLALHEGSEGFGFV